MADIYLSAHLVGTSAVEARAGAKREAKTSVAPRRKKKTFIVTAIPTVKK